MDRRMLERMLAEGLSLTEIGRRTGKHPSTVGYWLKEYRLTANGRDKYAPRGGIERDRLAELVRQGLTLAQIAAALDVSIATVRYWLERFELKTDPRRRRALVERARAEGLRRVRAGCSTHGEVEHRIDSSGRLRCVECGKAAVSERRRRVKRILVEEAGGRCAICGYDRCMAALEFHHLNPAEKAFNLSLRGLTRGIDALREEAAKCVLLCANCHAEVENGAARVPE